MFLANVAYCAMPLSDREWATWTPNCSICTLLCHLNYFVDKLSSARFICFHTNVHHLPAYTFYFIHVKNTCPVCFINKKTAAKWISSKWMQMQRYLYTNTFPDKFTRLPRLFVQRKTYMGIPLTMGMRYTFSINILEGHDQIGIRRAWSTDRDAIRRFRRYRIIL